ncbi:50S ribosomal protein L29 [Candidatus Roizmanbacteria bacterium]|nr:50S ribosomal protein L29 [Candidatus Roizmanbacteria bacterium]
MKKKEKVTLREKSMGELRVLLGKKRSEQSQVYLRMREEKNTQKIQKIRRDIAVILTLIHEVELREGGA